MFFKSEARYQDSLLFIACKNGDEFRASKAIIIEGANPNAVNEEGKTALQVAVEAGAKFIDQSKIFEFKKTIAILLSAGAKLNIRTKQGQTIFQLAAQSSKSDILDCLQDYQHCLETKRRNSSQLRVLMHHSKFSPGKKPLSPSSPFCDTELGITPRC